MCFLLIRVGGKSVERESPGDSRKLIVVLLKIYEVNKGAVTMNETHKSVIKLQDPL